MRQRIKKSKHVFTGKDISSLPKYGTEEFNSLPIEDKISILMIETSSYRKEKEKKSKTYYIKIFDEIKILKTPKDFEMARRCNFEIIIK